MTDLITGSNTNFICSHEFQRAFEGGFISKWVADIKLKMIVFAWIGFLYGIVYSPSIL